jgi:GDP-D-mannose 3',5'-epimerase
MHNTQINQNTVFASIIGGVRRVLFTSSACVYPEDLQLDTNVAGLAETDAWKGKPDTAYGVEKLVGEELYQRAAEISDLEIRIARFHNIYGPEGAWTGGREKAPAALCRKVAEAKRTHTPNVEIWGDGEQTRSFCHISDCLAMLYGLMQSDYEKPLNIGTDRLVSINELTDIIAEAAGIEIVKKHIEGPQGVRGRNADLSEMKRVLGYNPAITLEWGMGELYRWVEEQVYASD